MFEEKLSVLITTRIMQKLMYLFNFCCVPDHVCVIVYLELECHVFVSIAVSISARLRQ